VQILDNAKAAAAYLKSETGKIKSIVEGSEDEEGGILSKWKSKRTQDFWIRYEQRPTNMIVAPKCKIDGCHSNTEPMKNLKLRNMTDYAKYSSLYAKWRREEETVTELQELCDSLDIIVEEGMTKEELIAKLEEHYNKPKRK